MTLKHLIYFFIGVLFPLLSFAQEEEDAEEDDSVADYLAKR